MLHIKLLELEAEKLAREAARKAAEDKTLPPECEHLKAHIEEEIGIRLAAPVPNDFSGWLTYRRASGDLLIIRGKAFKSSSLLGLVKWRAGLDCISGQDSLSEFQRGFDVSPPQQLDHLMLNFGFSKKDSLRVFLWYGENIAPYRLIYEDDLENDIDNKKLLEAVSEGLSWVLNKPKELTLPDYLKKLS